MCSSIKATGQVPGLRPVIESLRVGRKRQESTRASLATCAVHAQPPQKPWPLTFLSAVCGS